MDENFNPDQLLKDIDAILDSQGMSTVTSPSAPVEIEADLNAVLSSPVDVEDKNVTIEISEPEPETNNIGTQEDTPSDGAIVEESESSPYIDPREILAAASAQEEKEAEPEAPAKVITGYASAGKSDDEMQSSKFTTIDSPKEWKIGDDIDLDELAASTPASKPERIEEPVSYLEGASMDGYAVENVAFGDISVGVETESVEYSVGHPFLRFLRNVLICVGVALVLSIVITKFVAHHTTVDGSSMENTLQDGDQLIVEELSYYLHDPERFDVIVFPTKTHESYIKRIIGLPGETVLIQDSQIFINGNLLSESYGKEIIEDAGLATEPIYLREDEYFVLGDNRNASVDSRSSDVGVIKREDISGKAWLRFYPFSSFSTIK